MGGFRQDVKGARGWLHGSFSSTSEKHSESVKTKTQTVSTGTEPWLFDQGLNTPNTDRQRKPSPSHTNGVRPRVRRRSSRHLSLVEREEISRGVAGVTRCGWWRPVLGVLCRRSAGNWPVTVAGSGIGLITRIGQRYADPDVLKPSKLAEHRELRGVVEEKLAEWWSPQQVVLWLIRTYPDDQEMQVSHETIYLSLFVQGKGALRRELTECLRTARAYRRPKNQTCTVG